eukprot:6346756-Lingulodinium_polyedra.AAC.1
MPRRVSTGCGTVACRFCLGGHLQRSPEAKLPQGPFAKPAAAPQGPPRRLLTPVSRPRPLTPGCPRPAPPRRPMPQSGPNPARQGSGRL